ncbi:MAG: hypothetical protein KDD69_00680 [Bdellovibrionales bacterium]|nr:hypothetical protein [Bdellovibrionales bacterium]
MEAPPGPDPEKLLLRLSDGDGLSREEIDEIVELLRQLESEDIGRKLSVDDVYSYLVVLGRAEQKQYRHVIEKFLDVRDALTVALVLETLCLRWDCTDEYLERVVSFALGVAWDEDQDVQQAAIKILGEFLHTAIGVDATALGDRQREVLELLLNLLRDDSLEHWTRQSSYFALCRAAGKDWEELPNDCVLLDLTEGSTDLDHEVLERLDRLAAG